MSFKNLHTLTHGYVTQTHTRLVFIYSKKKNVCRQGGCFQMNLMFFFSNL